MVSKKLQPILTPATIEEAVLMLYATLDREGEACIKDNPPEAVHHGGGTQMRNNWGLWKQDSPLKLDAVKTYGIAHADDISGLITAWLWARERGEPFDPVAHCEVYKAHWKKHGISALDAGNFNEDGTPQLK
jgi:hypothetical protein